MLVDWFTVAAQLINFAILVWLLKRLLYKRVLNAMDTRQQAILKEAEEAENQREQARNEAEAYTRKLASFDAEYTEKMKRTEEEIRGFRTERLSEVRSEIQEQRTEWTRSLEKRRHEFIQELRTLVGTQICESARKLVGDLADAPLEQLMLRHFVTSLVSNPEMRESLLAATTDQSTILTFSTTFPVDTETRVLIEEKLSPHLPTGTEFTFEHDTVNGALGVVLRAGNHRLEWNVDSYAEQLSHRVERALFSKPTTQTEADSSLVAS